MQKLIWTNANGDSVDLTSGNYGITQWEGFSNTSLNIQTQQVPFQDGAVFLDALMEQRELSVTLAMNDEGSLETRYRLRRELIHILNPKLGEGYLIYKNDFTQKRIKCVAQIPLFETHNSNDSGTPKASLAWTACEPYWEDLEEMSVFLQSGMRTVIENNGDVPCGVNIDLFTTGVTNPEIKSFTENKKIKLNGTFADNININTNAGQKIITTETVLSNLVNMNIEYFDIIYSETKNLFVLVGQNGTILTSPDGINWTNQNSNVTVDLMGIEYSEELDKFVVVGSYDTTSSDRKATILTSPDGINWTTQDSNTQNYSYLNKVAYSDDLHIFVAVGYSGKGLILTSPDGESWTNQSSEMSISDSSLTDIAYSKSLNCFVIVGMRVILTSFDGINWSESGSYNNSCVVYSENLKLFLICGQRGLLSSDGINWEVLPTTVNVLFNSVTYAEDIGLFIGVGSEGLIKTSPDGRIWTTQNSNIDKDLRGVVYIKNYGKIIAVGRLGCIIFSYNSIDWQENNTNNNNSEFTRFYGITYTKKLNLFVLVGQNGTILTSPDGKNWTNQNSGTTNALHDIVYSEKLNMLVCVGERGIVLVSSNGVNWQGQNIVSTSLTGITYSEDKEIFVAVGSHNSRFTSPDGLTWTRRTNVNNDSPYKVVYANKLKKFACMFSDGAILLSSDGITWSGNSVGKVNLKNIEYSENLGLFIVVGIGGKIFTSVNGLNWTEQDSGTTEDLYGVKYSENLGLFLVVGKKGINIISVNGTDWKIISESNQVNAIFYNTVYSEEQSCFINIGEYSLIYKLIFSKGYNLISTMDSNSDMTLSLEIGQNELLLTKSAGSINGAIRYRQKYIGV